MNGMADDAPAGLEGWYADPDDASGRTAKHWSGRAWGRTRKATQAELPLPKIGTVVSERLRILARADPEARERAAEADAAHVAKTRLLAIAGTRSRRDTANTRAFEYLLAEAEVGEETTTDLNRVGSLGWELINVIVVDNKQRFYFKREVWTEVDDSGKAKATAPRLASAAAAGGGGFFAAGYYESGLDLDADGDVDGGLFDTIQGLFE